MTESNPFDDFLGKMEENISGAPIEQNSNVASNVASDVITNTVKSAEKTIPFIAEVKEKEDDSLPDLVGDNYPEAYVKMVNRIKAQYAFYPKLDYDKIYAEVTELSIKSSPTPTLQVLNDELHRVQSAKDRLSEILIDVIKCYNFKKRAVDILKDSWGKFTDEKNTEGRKGDATFRLSDFLADFAETEALSKTCDHILKNLDSLHDSLSRRITIWQLIIKLRDIGRGGMPDHDYDRSTGGDTDINLFKDDENKDNEEGGNSGPKLKDF